MADSDERLAERTAAMRLDSAPSPSRPADLEILIPNPFERRDDEGHGASDAEMPTASPRQGPRDGRIAAAPALPQPPMYSGRTMQDRRDFMHKYEGYMVKVNALQTEWTAALAMPVSACIETDTRRMIARWEFSGASPETVTEERWKDYFRQALVPTFVDYALLRGGSTPGLTSTRGNLNFRVSDTGTRYRRIRPFVIYTDHASLRTATNAPHLSQRMARWLSFFAEYNFRVDYKPGKLNVLADALSRRPDYELAH
ncbi:Pol protein, partial [Phytophthora palmivora]